MSERPLHLQAADFVRTWMRDRRDADMGLNQPIPHAGPNKGPRDWYIMSGMLFGFWGLLKDDTLGGIIGAAIGVGIVGVFNLSLHLVKLLVMAIFPRRREQPEKASTSTVKDDPDIAAYYSRKNKQQG